MYAAVAESLAFILHQERRPPSKQASTHTHAINQPIKAITYIASLTGNQSTNQPLTQSVNQPIADR